MSRFVSPNELQEAACKEYLAGKTPKTIKDWEMCVNFWAFNINKKLAESACLLMARLFNCPLSEENIKAIVQFQTKESKKNQFNGKHIQVINYKTKTGIDAIKVYELIKVVDDKKQLLSWKKKCIYCGRSSGKNSQDIIAKLNASNAIIYP